MLRGPVTSEGTAPTSAYGSFRIDGLAEQVDPPRDRELALDA